MSDALFFFIFALICGLIGGLRYLYLQFIKKPHEARLFYNRYRNLVSKWHYEGGFRKMRKLRITAQKHELPLSLRIGFTYRGGYLFFGDVTSKTDIVVIETYLGRGGCEFIFTTAAPRNCTIELLPEKHVAVPDAVFKPHWWQKLWCTYNLTVAKNKRITLSQRVICFYWSLI
jgi:hypothetical protein